MLNNCPCHWRSWPALLWCTTQLAGPTVVYYILTDSKALAERAAAALGRDRVLWREESTGSALHRRATRCSAPRCL